MSYDQNSPFQLPGYDPYSATPHEQKVAGQIQGLQEFYETYKMYDPEVYGLEPDIKLCYDQWKY